MRFRDEMRDCVGCTGLEYLAFSISEGKSTLRIPGKASIPAPWALCSWAHSTNIKSGSD